ncbi:MAG TPA: indoleacetamide hydrolase [Vicinamibacteria bacterium]|nr:indoleacetamide hydrolase [Vicinamibacteria bacterium]
MGPASTTSRREFLARGGALAALASACRGGTPSFRPMGGGELVELTATEAVRALREGDVTAEDYASALLARCEAAKALNAFISLEPARVLEAARAADRRRASGVPLPPLHGLPIPIKDSINTRDLPTTGGTKALRNFHPREDAPLVRRLADAGGILMGKTNLHELSFGWTSNNAAFGAVRNPYDPTRIPGGSSGGTAAAVAARMAPLGVAADTEGSIRVPAAMCGICGFRPTTGRYPTTGVVPISPLFDQIGPHARSVADLVLFDRVASHDAAAIAPTALRGARIGVDRNYFFEKLDPEVARVAEEALRRLREAGAVLVEAQVHDLARFDERITDVVQYHDVAPMLARYLEESGAGLDLDQLLEAAGADVRRELEVYALPGGRMAPSEEAYRAARDVERPALRKELARYFRENEVSALIFPATLVPALPIGQESELSIGGETVAFATAMSRNIAPGSTAGIPGLVLPGGLTRDGLPVGLELDAPEGADRELLALGAAVERVLGHLPPPRL